MNAIVEPTLAIIDLQLVRESETNPRKRFDPIKLQELSDSIKKNGLAQPILARPHPDAENNPECVEIVAGARRFRASKMAGLQTIYAMVKDMSDIEVLELQLIENIQREDVHPIEEAEGYDRLMKEFHFNADQIAESVNKSRTYVYNTLKLLALPPVARQACYEGLLEISTAQLIARMPIQALQLKAMDEIINGPGGEPLSYRTAKQLIGERYTLNLRTAVFPIRDEGLVEAAGDCINCIKYAANQPEIYGDLKDADVCTDPDCFDSKTRTYHLRTLQEAEEQGMPVVQAKELDRSQYATGSSQFYDFERYGKNWGTIGDKIKLEDHVEPAGYINSDDKAVPYFEKIAVQLALEKAGLCDTIEKRNAEIQDKLQNPVRPLTEAQLQANRESELKVSAATLESNIRLATYRKVREECIREEGMSVQVLRILVKFLQRTTFRVPSIELADEYAFLGEITDEQRDGKFNQYVDNASAAEIEALLMDMILADHLTFLDYQINDDLQLDLDDGEIEIGVKLFAELSDASRVDVDQIRADLTAPVVEEEAPVEEPKEEAPTEAAAPEATKKAKTAKPKKVPAPKPDKPQADEKPPAKKPATPKKAATKKDEPLKPEAAWPFPRSAA